MKIYLLSSFIFLLFGCVFAADEKDEDNSNTTTRHDSTEVLGRQLLPYGDNTVTFEDDLYTENNGHVRFVDDTFVGGQSKNEHKENKSPTFPGVGMNADSNSKKVSYLDDLNDEELATDDQLYNPDTDFSVSEPVSNFNTRNSPHKKLVAIDYFRVKPENYKIQFENNYKSENTHLKDIKHAVEDINSEHISGKRFVFEEDYKNNVYELFHKKKKYKQTNRIPLIPGDIPKDPNTNYYGSGLPKSEYLGHNKPNHIYGAYPQDSLTQTNSAIQSGQRPGPYPGQESTGHRYSVHPGHKGQVGTGYGYATGYQGYYGPVNHEKTLAERAVSAVTEALASIALYDDKQCVPRLLCEMSSGSTANSPTLLKVTAALAPLLTILQSYNVASTSPLFLFGRAAVLGISSKGHPATCRYAYPQCPTDPDKLTHYLNNHNGGFFRFFGHPQKPKEQQNLGQVYNQESSQYNLQQQQSQQQNQQQFNYNRPYGTQSLYRPYYEQKSQNANEIDMDIAPSTIQGRIQNKPIINSLEDETNEEGSKWAFPDEVQNENYEQASKNDKIRRPKRIKIDNERGGNTLKFPDEVGHSEDINNSDEENDIVRKQRITFYPNTNHFYIQTNYHTTTPVNLEEYDFDYKHNFYVKRPKNIAFNRNNDESQILYVVRGNGDPNHPEIIKVRPGQRS